MPKGFFNVPIPKNEPVKSYRPGSPERMELKSAIDDYRSKVIELPMCIDGKAVTSSRKVEIHPPHDINHLLGYFYQGDETHVSLAIGAALAARTAWAELGWQHRASIFLKAADLLAGPYRAKLNAATMLGQSKNAYQAEIDAACELADFYRFGVQCMTHTHNIEYEYIQK
jgi:1-pyrroline-5-carboxylate dehydrogenase